MKLAAGFYTESDENVLDKRPYYRRQIDFRIGVAAYLKVAGNGSSVFESARHGPVFAPQRFRFLHSVARHVAVAVAAHRVHIERGSLEVAYTCGISSVLIGLAETDVNVHVLGHVEF